MVFAKLDRGFRAAMDAVMWLGTWQDRGVGVHMLDINLDTTTPVGMAIAQVIAVFAELERARISERTKEGLAVVRSRGFVLGSKTPWGFYMEKDPTAPRAKSGIVRGVLYPSPAERKMLWRIMELRDANMKSWPAISDWLQENYPNHRGKPWNRYRAANAYGGGKKLAEQGIDLLNPNPNV